MPRPPSERTTDNPWPTWPTVFRVDYGHAEVQLKFGRDPRIFNVMSKVRDVTLRLLAVIVCLSVCQSVCDRDLHWHGQESKYR